MKKLFVLLAWFSIHENTRQGIYALAGNLHYVSAERIQVELVKLLVSAHPDYLRTAYELSLIHI